MSLKEGVKKKGKEVKGVELPRDGSWESLLFQA